MSADQPERRSQADADLEREIREGRKFTLAEAIGRMAGPGAMKGISPATRKQQADAEIETYLERHLTGAAGSLPSVVLRYVKESELLVNNLDQPLVALSSCLQRILDSEYRLGEVVREADVEWGRVYGERPHFQKEDCPPHPDDPYTVDTVRAALNQLLENLPAGE